MRYSFSNAAGHDVDKIAAFYASDNPDAAARFIAEVDRVLGLLLDYPLVGERIDDG